MSGASLLLLDEPTAGATGVEAESLTRVMADHLLPGRTVLLVEHRLGLLRAFCTDLVFLQTGRKFAEGPPDVVLAMPAVRSCLMGEPADA